LGERAVLRRLCLSILKGEKAVLSGESGSGKSTLLRVLIGCQRLDTGEVLIDGAPLTPPNLAAIRSRMFYLPQDIRPIGEETVLEYLTAPFQYAVNRRRRFERDRALAAFDRLHLRPALLDSRFHELSGGERKRVGIVQYLCLARPIVLLDEPTAGVDEANRRIVLDALLGLSEVTMLAVTHDEELRQRASRRFALRDGAAVEEGI